MTYSPPRKDYVDKIFPHSKQGNTLFQDSLSRVSECVSENRVQLNTKKALPIKFKFHKLAIAEKISENRWWPSKSLWEEYNTLGMVIIEDMKGFTYTRKIMSECLKNVHMSATKYEINSLPIADAFSITRNIPSQSICNFCIILMTNTDNRSWYKNIQSQSWSHSQTDVKDILTEEHASFGMMPQSG